MGRGSAGQCLLPLAAAGFLLISSGVSAQQAAPIKLGETELTPAVRVDYLSIDNLYRDSTDVVSGSAVLVQPELVWRADRRLLALEAQYVGQYGVFSEDGLDYDNHVLSLQGVGNLSSKNRLLTNLSFRKATEEQGTGQTINVTGSLDEQIEITSVTAVAEYTYGASEARGNLRAGLSLGSVSYSNLEQLTDGDDHSFVQPYGVFSLRISPDTRVLAEVRFAVLDFDEDRRDRNDVSLLTGVEISSTSKLSGAARIGVVKATYDQNIEEDTTALIVETGLLYSPVSYSEFRLDYDRGLETEDRSNNNAGRSIADYAAIAWTHDWSTRFQTKATLNLENADRECPNYDTRTVGAGLELNIQLRRWLQFGISGTQSSRTLSACAGTAIALEDLDYDRAVVGVHVRATL